MGHRVVIASAVLAAATLIGVGPLSALATPPDRDCPKSDGNPDDGHGQDGLLGDLLDLLDPDCLPVVTTTTTSSSTTTTSPVTTTTAPVGGVTTTSTSAPTTTTTLPGTTTTTVPSVATPPAEGDDGSSPGAAAATPHGLGAIDLADMPTSLVGALAMVDKMDDAAVTTHPEMPETLSVRLDHLLGPAVPPALAEAVVSPIVVLQALVAAMTSSSQSLIVPGVVLLLGVGLPGRRRRNPDRALISTALPR
jgi:hypothetical protein